MQEKYEELLQRKEDVLVQTKAEGAQTKDKLQFELDYMQNELAS